MNKINFFKYITLLFLSYFIGLPTTLLTMSFYQFYHNQNIMSAYNLFGSFLYFSLGLWGTLVNLFTIFVFNALTNFEKTKHIYDEIKGEFIKVYESSDKQHTFVNKLLTNAKNIHGYTKKISPILNQISHLESNYYINILNEEINSIMYKVHEYLQKHPLYNQTINTIDKIFNDMNNEVTKLQNYNQPPKSEIIDKQELEKMDEMFNIFLKNNNLDQNLVGSLGNLENMENILSIFENIENFQPLNREQTRRLRKRGKKHF